MGGGPLRKWQPKLLLEFLYRNADVSEKHNPDYKVRRCEILGPRTDFHVAVLSFVLSAIPSESDRITLLSQLRNCTLPDGSLILFDDFEPEREEHTELVENTFFHRVRLGRQLLNELYAAGWQRHTLITSVDGPKEIKAESAAPYIISRKSSAG